MSRAYFEQVASQWDVMRAEFFSEAVRVRAADEALAGPGFRALDVGAGTGFLTEELLRRGARVSAVDASRAMVARLKEQYYGIDAQEGDAEALPYPDGAFDAVLANMCLHHVERPAVAIAEMARVLAPGGRLVLTDLDEHAFEFLQTEHHDRWMGFAHADVERWLLGAGLTGARIEGIGQECCATSACGSERAKVSIFLARTLKPTA